MLYEIDKSNEKLALKEIEVVAGKPKKVFEGIYEAKDTSVALGMTKATYKKIISWPKGSFKLVSHSKLTAKELTKQVWEKTSKKVDLKNPDYEIHYVNDYYIKMWQREKLNERRSHLLQSNHPTSTHPKIARAMINIAGTNEVFDPFCGAGGILLEAKILGKKIHGIDIDKIQTKRAKLNLNEEVEYADSFTKKWPSIIVTDLPYGRNSKIQPKFYEKFFEKVEHGVIGLPNGVKHPKTKFETTIYIHKSLSKKIILI